MLLALNDFIQLLINSKVLLRLCLISEKKVDMKIHHLRGGLLLGTLSWGIMFPRELRESRICEFLTHNQDSLNVHQYGFKFTQLHFYSPKMVKNMRNMMCLFVAWLGRSSSKEDRTSMLIGDIYILRPMIYVLPIVEKKQRDRDKFKKKRAKTGNESRQQKNNAKLLSF